MTGLDQARAVADAVLYEGYLLYPYRASAAKNQVRWQWGVLMPPAYTPAGEHSGSRTELLAEPGEGARLHVRLRFLQLQARRVQVPEAGGYRTVPSVTAGETEYTTWEEAVEREVDAVLEFGELLAGPVTVPFVIEGGVDAEPVPRGARLVRRRWELRGELRLLAEPLPGPFGGVKLRLDVVNTSEAGPASRDEALRYALIAAHSLLSLSAGSFLSVIDPPRWAAAACAGCRSERAWPVLVGEPGTGDTVLCSPIILYDYPQIAAESPGDMFDGTEIDEILTLRTMTLTDEEKRQARATDERAARLIDRVDNLPPQLLDRLHGAVRHLRSVTADAAAEVGADVTVEAAAEVAVRPDVPWWDPGADASVSPATDHVVIDGVRVARGSRVRLRPGRRADAHDMFIAGRTALVQAVLLDVDGGWHLAVTLEDDPGADLWISHGRYRYFRIDEVEPL